MSHTIRRLAQLVTHAGLVVALLACTSTEDTATAVVFHGSGVAAKPAPAPTVTAADPNYGQPGETYKQVRVLGSGFGTNAQVTWERGGAPDPKIVVHGAVTVSSREIVATISIAPDAELDLYDIAVTVAGKKGIGTEMFEVTKLAISECSGQVELVDSRAHLVWDDALAVRSDGAAYQGGQGSVHAKLFYHDPNCARSGDLLFDADSESGSPTRAMLLHFPANEIGLPATGVSSAPVITFHSIVQLGSDVNHNGVVDGRDAKMEAKYPGAARALEVPAASQVRPGYPDYPAAQYTHFRMTGTGIRGCETLEFAAIRLTRTGGVFTATGAVAADGLPLGEWSHAAGELGTWTVETEETSSNGTPGHWAQCLTSRRGDLIPNGAPMQMPFRVNITEVRP